MEPDKNTLTEIERVEWLEQKVDALEKELSLYRYDHIREYHKGYRLHSMAVNALDFLDRHKFLILALSFWAIGHALEYME